jgi:hypothetical protein
MPGTSYRYRLVAENAISRGEAGHEVVVGEERSFSTQPLGEFGLLDGRGYELVSPPDKLGALISPLSRYREFAVQAAAGGGAVTYIASAPTEPGAAGNAYVTQVLSSRGSEGWGTRDLSLPHERATALTEHPEWPMFSSDLGLAVVQPLGPFIPCASAEGVSQPCLSPAASEQTAFSYEALQPGSVEACASSCFTPLVTAANTPEGTEFGVQELGVSTKSDRCPPAPFCGPQFEAASPDLEHVLLHSQAALTGGTGGLFEASGGVLTFVGEAEASNGRRENGPPNFLAAGAHIVSTDGSRVVVKGKADGRSGLLVVNTVTGEALKRGGKEDIFVGASSDDRKVFFTNEGGGPLEMCEVIEEESGELKCNEEDKPLDLTPNAAVLAPLPGVSEDGSSVYFASTSALTGTEKDPGGEQATNNERGLVNMYVYAGGVTRLVAVLSSEDASDWGDDQDLTTGGHQDFRKALTDLTGRVSPDGDWLAFVSERGLTGYDTTQAQHGDCEGKIGETQTYETGKCREVYLYHASTEGQPASVVCASCDPTGERPHGGASVPGWTNEQYQSRYLSDGGRLFFDTPDALVPQDGNNAEDVYEYEPAAGAGGVQAGEAPPNDNCATSTPGYHPTTNGCVDLISSGHSPEPSTFLDATETGNEVFFLTTAQISKRDTDSSYDVYDANVDGSEQEPIKPVECQGDACQTPVAPPENLTPGSLTFTGPGNLLYTPPASTKKPAVKKKTVKCKAGFVRRTVKHKTQCVRSRPKKKTRGKK